MVARESEGVKITLTLTLQSPTYSHVGGFLILQILSFMFYTLLMEKCIFCKIAKKEIPSNLVFENDEVFAFLDINPVSDGHVLVIPKAHFEKLTDTPDEILAKLFTECKKMMIRIKKAMASDYVALSVVGVDVPHFHIHLIPRKYNDGLAQFWPTKKLTEEKTISEKIKKALG